MAFEREKVWEYGAYVVWGFKAKTQETWGHVPFVKAHLTGKMEKVDLANGQTTRDAGLNVFWEALSVLTQTGLVEFVEHIIDADTDEGTVLHPYADGTGEPGERTIRYSARTGRPVR